MTQAEKDEHARELAARIRAFAEVAGHLTVDPYHVRPILEWAALEIDPDTCSSS